MHVRGRGEDGWLRIEEVQEERLLEINFVDVGQGDAAFVVTPDDEFGVIDAGVGTHMRRFLSWRFNLKLDRAKQPDGERHETGKTVKMKFAVISHPDLDHYEGFRGLFTSPAFEFKTVFHNTLVERPASPSTDKLGKRDSVGGKTCVVGLVETAEQLNKVLDGVDPASRAKYTSLMREASESGRVGNIQGVTSDDGHLPGFGASHKCKNGKRLRIEVLGPVPLSQGAKRGLPWFTDLGKTKNGHSVVLRLVYDDVSILLGGDLNVPAEEHLLTQHVGEIPDDPTQLDAYLDEARGVFGVDVAKSCHHGSADFSTHFLRALNPLATVISSGDDEPHCHPRPNTLGAIGRHSRSEKPLIFSTELSRSTAEYTKPSASTQEEIRLLIAKLQEADDAERKQLSKKLDALLDKAERNVAVYGLIALRTDGNRIVIAQKLERPRDAGEEFDLQWLIRDADGTLVPAEGNV